MAKPNSKKPAKPNKPAGKKKKETKKKPAAPKKSVTPEVIVPKHSKATPDKDYHPATGSRFAPGTSAQVALEIVVAGAKEKKFAKEIREDLRNYRKENGNDRNLDGGYYAHAVASHPEHFKVWNTGKIEVVKAFKGNKKAMTKHTQNEEERKKRKSKRKSADKSEKSSKKKPKGKKKSKQVLDKK